MITSTQDDPLVLILKQERAGIDVSYGPTPSSTAASTAAWRRPTGAGFAEASLRVVNAAQASQGRDRRGRGV